jgi:hypothetical protein
MSPISELIGKQQKEWSDRVMESTIKADHTSDLSHVHQLTSVTSGETVKKQISSWKSLQPPMV